MKSKEVKLPVTHSQTIFSIYISKAGREEKRMESEWKVKSKTQ